MKQIKITDRQAVAKALNFGTYPVLTIDLADRDEYGLVGCKVRIDFGNFRDGNKWNERATLRVFSDEKNLTTSSHGCCIHEDYSYSDVEEMLEWAKAPLIAPNQEVVLVITDSKRRCAYDLYIIRTADFVRKHCITPLDFEPVDLSQFF